MRRRTTILDVLREDRRHEADRASSAEGAPGPTDEAMVNEREDAVEDEPSRGRRGRAARAAEATPDATTLRRRLETRTGRPPRRTQASGKRRGLLMADWLQSDFTVPRGYVVLAGVLLVLGLWGVFLVGRMNGGPADNPKRLATGPEANTKPTVMGPGWSDTSKGDRKISPAANSREVARRTAAFQIVSYAPVEANKAYIRSMMEHLQTQLKEPGVEVKAFARTQGDRKAWVVAVLLPESGIGDETATTELFDRLKRLPAPRDVQFDFSKLQRSEIPFGELPAARKKSS